MLWLRGALNTPRFITNVTNYVKKFYLILNGRNLTNGSARILKIDMSLPDSPVMDFTL